MTVPLAMGGYPPRRKTLRELLAESAALPHNAVPDAGPSLPGRYALSEVADAGVDRTQPSSRDRILRALTGAAVGLTSQYRTEEPGADRFLGGAGQAFLATQDVAQGYEDRDRAIAQQEMTAAERIRLRIRQEAQDRLDQENVQADNDRADATQRGVIEERQYNRGRDESQDRYRMRRDKIEDSQFRQREGRLAAAGDGEITPEAKDEREYVQQRIRELTRPRYDSFGAQIPGSALTVQAATTRAREEYRASTRPPADFGDVRGGSSTGGGPSAKSPADRWEELVNGGMDEATATAQVKREFPGR
jgi:hypothetical protein